jgi:SAM-dependent methyltransferase
VAPSVTAAYTELLGRPPDPAGLEAYVAQVRAGRPLADVLRELSSSREAVVRAARRLGLAVDERDDSEFIADLYRDVLHREADASGRAWLQGMLDAGASRQHVTLTLAGSDESLNRQLAALSHIQDLRELRPGSFRHVASVDGDEHEVFAVDGPDDVDWMEAAILEHGYYEKPGIWSLAPDDDKRRMGKLLSTFAPTRALEMGCSSGTVLAAMAGHGVRADGLEISRMAIQRAEPAIRGRIRRGDLLEVDLEPGYDLVFALDVVEHLNPNRFDAYLRRLRDLLEDDGYLFVNSPAFGPDPVYGEVFPLLLPGWRQDAAAGRPFREWLVDEDGYPVHGHLVWAASEWWTSTFAAAGFHRQVEVEQAVHRVYDAAFEAESLARKAFFVFSRSAEPAGAQDVVARFDAHLPG